MSISFAGTMAAMVISLVRVSFLTKNLSVVNYGKVLIIITLFNFIITFLEIRVQDILFRYYPIFRKENKKRELLGIIWICFAACLMLGLLVGFGLFFSADWVANTFYEDPELTNLIKIYSVTAFVSTFFGFYTSILRVNDQFSNIVIPQVTSAILDMLIIVIAWYTLGTLSMELVIISTAISTLMSRILPLISAFKIIKTLKPSFKRIRSDIESLSPYKKEVRSMFYQSNLAGYLKLAETGGPFLLGILSTPTQVALYGLAQKILKPLDQLQKNIQTAVTPEVHSLYAHGKYGKLNQLIKRFFRVNVVIAILFFATVFFLAKPFILLYAKSEYLEALPNLYIQLAMAVVIFPSLVIFPLTVTMNQLKRLNVSKSLSYLYLGIAALLGMNAVTLSLAQLFGALTNKLTSDLVIYKKFVNQSKEKKATI